VIVAVAVTFVLAGFVGASCPGVDHTNSIVGSWEYEEFFESASSTPLTVELTITKIDRNTEVYYYDGSWNLVTESTTVYGSKTKFSEGGFVHIAYTYGECGGEIQPHDD